MLGFITENMLKLKKEEEVKKGFKSAKVIAVVTAKGGVGKTTTAVNLSAGLARKGESVLLIDLDAQCHVSSSISSISGNGIQETLSGIILGKGRDLMTIVYPTAIPNLYFVPSDRELHQTEGILNGKIGREFILKGCLKTARTHFDYIIIDCPPKLGILTLNALVASDYCIVPCEMSIFSAEAVKDFILTLETIKDRLNHNIELLGILLTKVDRRNPKVNESVMEVLRQNFDGYLLPVEIPANSAIAHSQIQGKPVILTAPHSKGAAAYNELVSLVRGVCTGTEK